MNVLPDDVGANTMRCSEPDRSAHSRTARVCTGRSSGPTVSCQISRISGDTSCASSSSFRMLVARRVALVLTTPWFMARLRLYGQSLLREELRMEVGEREL